MISRRSSLSCPSRMDVKIFTPSALGRDGDDFLLPLHHRQRDRTLAITFRVSQEYPSHVLQMDVRGLFLEDDVGDGNNQTSLKNDCVRSSQ